MRLLRLIVLGLLSAATFCAAAESAAAPAAESAIAVSTTAAAPLTRDLFLSELARDLSAHFNVEGDLQLELMRSWAPPARLAAQWRLEVLEYPSLPTSSMLVRCRILADDEAAAEVSLVLRASLWRDAWVSRLPLVAASTFDPAQLDTRRVDLFRDRDALPAAVGDRSYVFARAVGPGRLLTWHDIARRPLVKKGNLVEVSATEGQLIITMKALAMENGAQGDTVTVRNPESHKDFAAMVVDENRVQVRF